MQRNSQRINKATNKNYERLSLVSPKITRKKCVFKKKSLSQGFFGYIIQILLLILPQQKTYNYEYRIKNPYLYR